MKTVSLFLLLFFYKSTFAQLYINEVMASNTSTIQDNQGLYSDWIEIYNSSNSDIDLANYYLTDSPANLTKFRFTALTNQVVVPRNGYLIIWASDNTLNGYNHTNFSLSSTNGEAVYLVDVNGTSIINSLTFPSQRDNVSYGRQTDASSIIRYFSPSSPNSANNPANGYEGILAPPIFSRNGGFFNANFNLTLSHTLSGVSIYYTTDGSDPISSNLSGTSYTFKNSFPENPGDPFGSFLSRSYQSSLYTLPLNIQDKSVDANQVSMLSSTWNLTPAYLPSYLIKKGSVVRAIAYKTGYLPSNIATNTYIYSVSGNNSYSFPVVSVAMQENHLFEYNNGIYTAGVTFDNYRTLHPNDSSSFCTPGNFTNNGSLWERPGNMELVENQFNVLNQPLNIRIHGSCSASAPYKSLRFYGKNKFDNYPFFPGYPGLLHERIILRNSGNDYNQTMFKDAFVQKWLGHLRFASQKSRPSIMFLNGEYWGVHNIRERIDKYFLNALYGVDTENLDMLEISWDGPPEYDEGDSIHYQNMYNFITTNNMADPNNYNQAIQYFDPDNLVDYQASETFIGNIDWPQNNVKLWRTRNDYSPTAPYGQDGRWRWILYDTDRSLGEVVNYENQDIEYHTNKPENLMFKKLLENNIFKNAFINRYADLLNSAFKPSYSMPLYSSLKSIYAPEIPAHIERWENLTDLNEWEKQCNIVNTYIENRSVSIYDQIKRFFVISGDYNLTLTTPDTSKGFIRVNALEVKSSTKGLPSNVSSWTGIYFDAIPLSITAVPKTGFKFSYWLYQGLQFFDATLTFTTSSDRTYQAFFEPIILSDNPIPAVAAELVKCGYSLTKWEPTQPLGASPPNSKFVYLNLADPPLSAQIEGFTNGVYNHSSKTRINGLDTLGFSFINTSSDPINPGYPNTKLGGFLLAINTMNLDTIKLTWTARTITPNPKKYKIRLYFREGDVQPFQEFNPLVEYSGNTIAGHKQTFSNIVIPNDIMNKPYVQLLWKYYYVGPATSGARDQLAIDDIYIKGTRVFSSNLTSNINPSFSPNYILNSGKIQSPISISNFAKDAIILKPGFESNLGSVFKAEIKTCN